MYKLLSGTHGHHGTSWQLPRLLELEEMATRTRIVQSHVVLVEFAKYYTSAGELNSSPLLCQLPRLQPPTND